MKRALHFLPLLAFLLPSLAGAADRYWVGGSGNWNESKHWSVVSGGKGGAGVPTENDNVFFDAFSFKTGSQQVTLNGEASCLSMSWKHVLNAPSFAGNASSKLFIHGSLELSASMQFAFAGEVHFVSSTQNNTIVSAGKKFNGNIYFDNPEGYWILHDDFATGTEATVHLLGGTLHTNSRSLTIGSFNANSGNNRGIIAGNSKITIQHTWNVKNSSGFFLTQDEGFTINFATKQRDQFQSGNIAYKNINLLDVTCPPLVLTTDSTPDSCNVAPCTGTATVTIQGGTPPYTIVWTPSGQTTQTATGLCPGSYIVDVTDALGNNCADIAQVTQPAAILINHTFVRPLCFGDCNGSITANPIGGVTPYTYLWTPTGQTTQTATGLCAGTYTVVVTDSYDCTQQKIIILTQPAAIVPNGSSVNPLCFGDCTGSVTVNPTGGTPPFTYLWAPSGATTNSISGLCAPTCHTVTITDANGCDTTFSACITQPPLLTANITTTNNPVDCNGDCDATATVNPNGGVAPYTYLWTPGNLTSQTITGLCAGTYTVVVTDANGCTRQVTTTITQPTLLTATQSQVNLQCNNACIGTATVNPAGGTPAYSWSWSNGQTTQTATALCAGSYTCTVTDANGCTIQVTFTITQPPALTTQTSQTNPLCFGQCNGTATVTAGGGTAPYTYSWNPTNQTTSTATGLCGGNYTVTVTDANGCTIQATFTITTPPQLTATTSLQNVSCNGQCDGTATVNPSGGTPPYTYLWNPTGQTTQTATGLCAGSYTCTITDANGCTITRTFLITQPPVLTVTLNATSLDCNGDCDAIITTIVAGGVAPYTYSWSPGNQTTPSLNNQCAGTYTVTVTDANGCTATANITINQPTALTLVTAVNPASCFGVCDGSATTIVGGGTSPYTYAWAPLGQTTSSITNQCAGTYTVTVTDANGCTISQQVTITEPTQLLLGLNITNVTCNGACDGTATTNVSGGTPGYTFLWMPGNLTTSSVSNLCPGSYTVTVTDANGCTAQQIFLIQQPPPLNVVISNTTTACNICNGTATATPNGGTSPYQFSWTTSPSQSTQTATGLCPGTYTCFITDANGCTASAVATVTLTVVIQITTSGSTLLCFGDSSGTACAAPSGGQAPYSYLWFTSPFQTTQCATGLSAGTYTVIATDANGCTGIDSVTFTNPPQLISSAVTTNTSCNQTCDGTATGSAVGGTGSYTYSWAPVGQTTQTATGLCAGTYTLYVTDVNGCTDTTAVTITQSPALAANPTVTDANCNQCDGSITVNPSGGIAPYTFLWTPGNFTTSTINNLCVGVYTLIITDAAGCTDTFNIVVNNINGPTVTLGVTDATCNGGCDGVITSNVNGGTPPYTYSWQPGNQTTTSISGLCAGGYTLLVTDQPGCVTITTAIINEPTPITWTPLVVNSTCANNCNGSVDLTPTGGTPPYTFSWSTGDLTEDVSGLCAGTYTVIIFDANLCSDTTTFTITQPALLTVTTTFTNVNCNAGCDGTATATPAGGTGPYLFNWQPGNIITPTIVGLCPGSYTVTITDANGCTTTDTVTVTEPTVLTATTTQTNATCFGVCDGTALVTASGGTPAYTYSWTTTPSQSTPNSTGLCAGQYNIHVIDANGCENIQTVIITEPNQILPNATVNNASCNALCNGTATATPTGGNGGPYTYAWSTSPVQTTPTATGLCAGTYTVTVTDGNGCTGTQIVIINQPAPVVASPSVQTQPTCGNVCNGSLTANPFGGTGPYQYLWTPGNITTQTATGLCTGTYTILVTDANGCTDQQTINLPAPNPLTVVYSVAPANCGVCDGALTANASGGTQPYTYSWSTGTTTATDTGLCAGVYTLLVTDAMGCTQLFTVGLSNSSGGILTMGATAASCFGVCDGAVSVSATGSAPFNYTWSPNNCTTTNCGPLCAGSYTVTVTDSAGCLTIDSIQVTQPTQILDNAVVVNAQCNGICTGSITLNASGSGGGPYTYTWLTPPNATTSSINNLCTGTYIVEVTAANGCRDTFSYTVNGTTVINITSTSTNINCSNSCTGTATVTNITGGASPYTYSWNDPLGQFTPTATGLCAGTYIVTITDANGCMNSDTVTVTQTPGITASFNVTNPACGQCNGSITVTPSGGTSPYTLLWNTGATTATITGACAGVYSVVITDANGCSVTLTVPVSNSTSLTSGLTVTNETCFGACDGSASVSPSGGIAPYVINWTPSNQNTTTINNLCAGTYYVQVTDAAGCIITDSVVIGGPTQIVTNQAVVNTDCGSCAGSISLNPSGGTAPYTYLWSTGATTSSIISLCAGTYTVTITDANGCTQQYVIPITNTNGPSVTVSTTNIDCSGSCTGTATANASGGQAPYTYSWSTGAVTPAINGLCSGNYWVMVTDANGCTAVANFTIIQTNPISFSAPIAVDPLCNGDANGTITVVPNGGTLPYNYSWSAPGGTTSTLSGLTAGSYTVYVTDANGCSDSLVITLANPPVLSATNGGVISSSCNTVADGAITLNVTGGTPGYTFTWSNGATTQNVSNLLSGGYTVTVTDANGCTDTVQFIVPAAISVIANITGTDTICLGDCADLYATTSVNATTYSWYDMPGGNLQSTNDTLTVCPPLIGQNFFILIASNGACSDTDTIAIVVNALPVADAGADVSILTNTSATIGGNPTGPSGSTFSWFPANGLDNTTASNPTASPSITTTYYVMVTSPEGCTDIDTVVVTVVPEIVFPNGISPNGDGANDYWIIDNIQLFPDNVVEIYNRWGELLFRGIGYDNSTVKWDGTYKGEQLPVGTYYYIIELETDLLPEENKRFTGPITLMR